MLRTALLVNKSFTRSSLVHINKFMNRYNWLAITNKIRNRLTSGITHDRITCITGTDRFTNIKCFDELANTAAATFITFCHIITDRFTNNWCLTSWLILLTLQTLCSVALLEQTDLRTWNGLTSWLTLLVLQTLRFVVLLDKTGLLRFHGLMSWLVLLALQILRLVVLLEKTGLLRFNGLMSWLALLALQRLCV